MSSIPTLNIPALETAVLAALLQFANAPGEVIRILRGNADVFSSRANRTIFRAICSLFNQGQAVDPLTLTNYLQSNNLFSNVGGATAIGELSVSNTTVSYTKYCLLLLEHHTKREIVKAGQMLITKASQPTSDPHELLAEAQVTLDTLHNSLQFKRPLKVGELFDTCIDEIVIASQNPSGITGVATGLSSLDNITGGFQPSDLIVLGARPAVGKTSLALAMACMAAKQGAPCLFVSLEMADKQLIKKIIATATGHSTMEVTQGRNISPVQAENLRIKAAALRSLDVIIDDTPGLTIGEFRAKVTKAKQEFGIKWAIIDYLQLMNVSQSDSKPSVSNRQQEISNISRGLKLLAKELNIPILVLSQLSRASEIRGGEKRPQLSDLRESGAIEQDADIVIFPYRPEMHGITDKAGQSLTGVTELIIAKHRNGPTASVLVRSDMDTGKYEDLVLDEL